MFSLLRQNGLIKKTINHQMVRSFLTNQQIGLDRFLKGKEFNQHLDKEILVNNIKKSLEDDFVYTNDIKSLAYAIDTPEDAKLLKEAFIKFASKGEPIRLTDFKIGPVISRALYNIDDLETLEELVNNEKTKEHFELRTSVTVYLSFLYKKEKYENILNYAEKIFSKVLEKDATSTISPEVANALTIYLAAANKVSSKETLDRARKLLHKYKEKLNETQRSDRDRPQLRLKHIMLYHLLCIKNNEFTEALEILSGFEKLEHYEFLNARAAILIRLGRTDECLVVIDKIINSDKEDDKPRYVFTETINIIKQYLEKYPHDGLKSKIDSLNQEIILDAKIEDTVLALPNAKSVSERRNTFNNQNRFNQNRQFGQNRQFSNDFNRFTNRNQGGGMRFNDGQRNFQRQDNFNRFNNNNNFNRNRGNRFNDNFGDDQPRRNFRPFQTRFKEENSDLI